MDMLIFFIIVYLKSTSRRFDQQNLKPKVKLISHWNPHIVVSQEEPSTRDQVLEIVF